MKRRAKVACTMCTRVVAVRFPHQVQGKARMPHLCPHGEECIAGKAVTGFNWPTCAQCRAERKTEYAQVKP